MFRIFAISVFFIWLGAELSAQADEPMTLRLPTTGNEVRTPPLEAFRDYWVKVRSPFDLKHLWGFWTKGEAARYALMFDGHLVSDKTRITQWDYKQDMNELVFAFRGKGDPLAVRLDRDLSALIRHATLEIVPVPVAPPAPPPPAPKVPAKLPAVVTPAVAPRETTTGDGVLERAAFALPTNGSPIKTALPLQLHRSYDIRLRAPHNLGLLCGKPRPELFALQLSSQLLQREAVPACQERRDVAEIVLSYTGRGVPLQLQMATDVSDVLPQVTAELSPTLEPVSTSRLPAVVFWVAGGVGVIVCWRLYAAVHRARRREEVPIRDAEPDPVVAVRLALPSGNPELKEAREELARARQMAQEARREAAYAKQVTAHFRREQDEVHRRATALAHWAELECNFLDPDYQERYAAKHLGQVLGTDKHRWFQEAKDVRDDEALSSLLEREYPQVLQVLEARLEVIRIAERLEVEPSRKPRLTPEEHQQRIQRFREHLTRRIDVKAHDFIAKHTRKLALEREFAQDLDNYDLDQEERETLMQAFRDELTRTAEGEEEPNGSYKTAQP